LERVGLERVLLERVDLRPEQASDRAGNLLSPEPLRPDAAELWLELEMLGLEMLGLGPSADRLAERSAVLSLKALGPRNLPGQPFHRGREPPAAEGRREGQEAKVRGQQLLGEEPVRAGESAE